MINSEKNLTQALKNFCDDKGIGDASAPGLGQSVRMGLSTMFKVKITEDLFAKIEFSKCGQYEAAFIDGIYSKSSLEDHMAGTGARALPAICASRNEADKENVHDVLLIGDPKLNAFKEILLRSGIKTEFYQSSLICEDSIIITKVSSIFFYYHQSALI